MKVSLPKSRITAPIDFGEAIAARRVCGVDLSYTEYDFIQIPSGRAAVFDAYSVSPSVVFNAECGAVAFPFYCGCMTDAGERVAYAGLRFGEDKAVKWEIAYLPKDMSKLVVDPDAAAIAVPSGVCCLGDAEDCKLYRAHINDAMHPLAGLIVLNGETHAVVKTLGVKLAVFSSGWGDGRYKCYKGIGADGRVTAFLVDFGLIDYPDDGALVETDIDCDYIYDPNKSDKQNDIARWTAAFDRAKTAEQKLDALSRRGYARHSSGDTDGALDDYEAAIAVSASVAERRPLAHLWSVFDNAAELYAARGELDRAIEIMKKALETGDNCYAGAYVRLVDLYLATGKTDKAKEIAERMMNERRHDGTAVMKYAECCEKTGDYAAAANAHLVLADEFGMYEHLFDAAKCHIESGEREKAIAALDKHPAKEYSEQYWYYKARIEMDNRNPTRAKEYAARARVIDGGFLPALKLLTDINALLQDHFAAAGCAEEYKRLAPTEEYGYMSCARSQLMLGNFSECARNYCYVFDKINKTERNAALAALACRAAGDGKRRSRMLKFLRRRHSPYYIGATCDKFKFGRKNIAIIKGLTVRLRDDREFLVRLSEFLTARGKINFATPILEFLSKTAGCEYVVVAEQIRAAVAVGDKSVARAFFEFYITSFVGDATADRRRALATAFGLNF